METQESALHDKLKNAAAECDNPGAWSNGTWQFSPNDLNLFYRSNSDVRFLEWANATAVDLEQLGKVCDPATFGANQQDVLDETYRKAGKMDTDRFSLNMCPERSGLAHVVKMGLLGLRDERSIKLEMYKLNVYGEGSFFKAHKDTPHGDTMFGSLVIVLPSLHQGGALLLKHEGKEVTIDAAKDLDAKPPGTVAWVAFYSDVEHEVEQVVSGHRVTITYNLYFTDSSTLPLPKELLDTENLTEVLRQLLIDEKFLPGGGTIGFGLKHQYPLPSKKTKAKHLKSLLGCLKGADAAVLRACVANKLEVTLKVIYVVRDYRGYLHIMCDRALDTTDEQVEDMKEELINHYKGQIIHASKEILEGYRGDTLEWDSKVEWITPMKSTTQLSSTYIAYGNEASLGHIYGDVSLIVYIGVPGDRLNASSIEAFDYKTEYKVRSSKRKRVAK